MNDASRLLKPVNVDSDKMKILLDNNQCVRYHNIHIISKLNMPNDLNLLNSVSIL